MSGQADRDFSADTPPFLSLDFLYVPTHDAERDFTFYTRTLGAIPVFRIKAEGSEVSAIRLSQHGPLFLLADHLEGELPILIYRVASLEAAKHELERRGWTAYEEFEIPHGPICAFTATGGQRLAIYELTRPEAAEHFAGRFDVG
jgi:hypothetical protein